MALPHYEMGAWAVETLATLLGGEGGRAESVRMPCRTLEFDVLVPWGTTEGDSSYGLVADQSEMHDRIDAMIDRVEAGGDR